MKKRTIVYIGCLVALLAGLFFKFGYLNNPSESLEERLMVGSGSLSGVSKEKADEIAEFQARIRGLPDNSVYRVVSPEQMVDQVKTAISSFEPGKSSSNKKDSDEVKSDLASLRDLSSDGNSLSTYRDPSGQILGISTSIPLQTEEKNEDQIARIISDHRAIFGGGPHDKLFTEIRTRNSERTIDSFVVKRKFKGLPVWGNALKVTTDRTSIIGFNGSFVRIPAEFDTSSKLTPDEFKSIVAANEVKAGVGIKPETVEEGIYFINNLPIHAYRGLAIKSMLDVELVYVSPSSRKVVSVESRIHQAAVASRGIDLKGNREDFFSIKNGDEFFMADEQTLANISEANLVFSQEGPEGSEEFPLSSSNNAASGWDPAAVSALGNVRASLIYFKETHGRSSFDDKGHKAQSVANYTILEDGFGAWWNSEAKTMIYGTGAGIVKNFAIARDVAGHELTHGIITATSDLEYKNQSGALNESFADIFGVMISRESWIIGQDLEAPANLRNRIERDLAQPWTRGNPGHMDQFVRMPINQDYGGVHTNSSIPNRAFYLLAQGLSEEEKGESVGLVKAEKIAYQTMIGLSRNDRFIHAAIKMIQVAEALHGRGSPEVAAVKASWSEVGVYTEDISEDTEDTVSAPNPIDLAQGEDILFFLYPRDGDLEASTVYDEPYDIYGISVDPTGLWIEETLIGPFNDVPASAKVPFAYTLPDKTSYLIYKGTDGQIYFTDLTGAAEDEAFDVDFDINQMAISPDGLKLAVVPSNLNLIVVADLENDEVSSYEARGPDFSSDQSISSVDLVDAIDFDLASGRIVFDYRTCNRFGLASGEECREFWNIGILDLTTGFSYPFPNLGADLDIGNPKFSKIGRDTIVFDLFDYAEFNENDEIVSVIMTVDFTERKAEGLSVTTNDLSSLYAGAPSFVGEDQAVSFNGNFDPEFTSIVRAKLNESYAYDEAAEDGLVFFIPYEAAWAKPHRLAFQNISAELSVWPSDSFYFGRFERGTEKRADILLRNTGNRKIEIFDLEISDGLRTSMTNATLLAGEQQAFQVYLDTNGIQAGEFSGQIRVKHDGDNSDLVIGFSADILAPAVDSDSDGYPDQEDNCPEDPNQNQIDTDSDGQGDACDSDDDEDGITDVDDEAPKNADRDGDGIKDGQDNCPNISNADQADGNQNEQGDVCDSEVSESSMASGSESIEPGEQTFNGKEYRWIKERKTQTAAQAHAESQGGHLAVINSAAEHDFVYSLVRDASLSGLGTASDGGGVSYVWLGGNDASSEGNWVWVNGDAFSYTNWGRAEPDNYLNQDGLAMGLENWPAGRSGSSAFGLAGEWNDIDRGNELTFIVELPLESSDNDGEDDSDSGPETSSNASADFESSYSVSLGPFGGCAIDDSGLDCWGTGWINDPSQFPILSNPRQVTAGRVHACVLDDSGVSCWGFNEDGQTNVPSLSNPYFIVAEQDTTCALDDSGVKCWGDNSGDKAGITDVPRLVNPREVAISFYSACALDDTGIVCWGDNSRSLTTTIPDVINPSNLTLGDLHGCVIDNGRPICWANGFNTENVANRSTVGATFNQPELINPRELVSGGYHVCAIDDLDLKCWGRSTENQLELPQVTNPSKLHAAGQYGMCVLDDNGLQCWGGDEDSVTELPTDLSFTSSGRRVVTQYLQTTSASQNISTLDVINTSDRSQTFRGILRGGSGEKVGLDQPVLGTNIPSMGRLSLTSSDLEDIFEIAPWSGPAMLTIQGDSTFDLMSKLESPSGLVSNTNCVRDNRVLNLEGFDSNNLSYVRLINTGAKTTGAVTGTLYAADGSVVGTANTRLVSKLDPYQQTWVSRDRLSSLIGAEWNGEGMLEVNPVPGLKLLNLNFVTDESTFFNFSCADKATLLAEPSSSSDPANIARMYLQTTSTSANVSLTHLVNTSDSPQRYIGTLYGSDGAQVGSADQPLHSGTVPAKGRLIISSTDIESAFNISPWRGPAILEVKGDGLFELMTKLESPSGLISNTNCVRTEQVHNLGGFDQTDVSYVRFINVGDTDLTNIRGTLFDDNGNAVGSADQVLVDSLPAKSHVWRNRSQLSTAIGARWNGTASLRITSAPEDLRLLNLNYINSETFFNFSCYQSGR